MKLLGTEAAAQAAGISVAYVRLLLKKGMFPQPTIMGGSFFWELKQIKEWRVSWKDMKREKK